jgi:hypothetical protein
MACIEVTAIFLVSLEHTAAWKLLLVSLALEGW